MLTKNEFALGFLLTTCKSKFRVGFKPIISDALKSIDKPVVPEPDVTSNTFEFLHHQYLWRQHQVIQ